MTKADFDIIRNSITMHQLANFHGFKLVRRGGLYFSLCPFHSDKNASMQIFDGYRGFYCRGCGVGGDVIRFTQMYENLSPKDAVKVLSERFNVPITENGTIPPEAIQWSKQAELERQQEKLHQQQIQAELRRLGTLIYGYRRLLDEPTLPIDSRCFIQGELPWMEYQWEYYFSELRK